MYFSKAKQTEMYDIIDSMVYSAIKNNDESNLARAYNLSRLIDNQSETAHFISTLDTEGKYKFYYAHYNFSE